MTQKATNNGPFGLSIAVGIAMKMFKTSNVAPSTILANLFSIQKSTTFPKDLDEHFFENNQYRTNDAEKKVILAMLDEMKKPNVDVKKMLTEFFTPIWVKKIPPVAPKPAMKAVHKFNTQKKVDPSKPRSPTR